jgi:hypothetical protein
MEWLIGIGVFIFGLLMAYLKGVSSNKNKEKIEDLQEDLETMKRIKNVEISTTLDAATSRLRANGDLRDD